MLINQWLPAAHRGDAIGDSARRVRDLLRAMGHESHIYALTIDDDMRDEVRPFDHADARRGDITIFHFALPSPMSGAFRDLPRGRVLQYHNITPAHFFAPYDPASSGSRRSGRRRAGVTAGHATWRSAIPTYNRQELETLGFRRRASCRSPSNRATDEAPPIRCSTHPRTTGLPTSCSSAAWRQQADRGHHPAG